MLAPGEASSPMRAVQNPRRPFPKKRAKNRRSMKGRSLSRSAQSPSSQTDRHKGRSEGLLSEIQSGATTRPTPEPTGKRMEAPSRMQVACRNRNAENHVHGRDGEQSAGWPDAGPSPLGGMSPWGLALQKTAAKIRRRPRQYPRRRRLARFAREKSVASARARTAGPFRLME